MNFESVRERVIFQSHQFIGWPNHDARKGVLRAFDEAPLACHIINRSVLEISCKCSIERVHLEDSWAGSLHDAEGVELLGCNEIVAVEGEVDEDWLVDGWRSCQSEIGGNSDSGVVDQLSGICGRVDRQTEARVEARSSSSSWGEACRTEVASLVGANEAVVNYALWATRSLWPNSAFRAGFVRVAKQTLRIDRGADSANLNWLQEITINAY